MFVGAASSHHPQQLPVPGEAHLPQPGRPLREAWPHGDGEDHAGQYGVRANADEGTSTRPIAHAVDEKCVAPSLTTKLISDALF